MSICWGGGMPLCRCFLGRGDLGWVGVLLWGCQQPQYTAAGHGFPSLTCSPPPGRSDGPLCAGAEAAGEGEAAAATGVPIGVAGQVWAVCQRRAVCAAPDRPQRGRAALLRRCSPSPREDVHPGQLAHQAQACQHGRTPLPRAKKIHDLQLGSCR